MSDRDGPNLTAALLLGVIAFIVIGSVAGYAALAAWLLR